MPLDCALDQTTNFGHYQIQQTTSFPSSKHVQMQKMTVEDHTHRDKCSSPLSASPSS